MLLENPLKTTTLYIFQDLIAFYIQKDTIF